MGALFSRLALGALLCLPVYVLVRLIYLRISRKRFAPAREVTLCLLALFMAGLLALVFQPGSNFQTDSLWQSAAQRLKSGEGINFAPFSTIRSFFASGQSGGFIVNIVANVLMFAPPGFCLPLLWRRWQHWYWVALAGLGFSLFIECTQLFIGRSVDVDDVILNTLGFVLGYGLYLFARKALPKATNLAQ